MKNGKLIIIAGPSGSGKTTYAKNLIASGKADCYFEADMWMVDNDGNYKFDPKRLGICHHRCLGEVIDALMDNKTVIQSNTNLTKKEVENYIHAAKTMEAEIEIIHLEPKYKNVHGVPDWKIEQMKNRRQYYKLEDFK